MSVVAPLTCRELVTLVTDYLEDRLSPEDTVRFDEHIAGCPHCTTYLVQLRETIRLTGTLRVGDLEPEVLDALLDAFRGWS